ncbi:MAG TPA: methyltransferase domain-containing protein [Bryobacteraceae bacterium]|nr:methyltransferase domain-containing protein [Bryobacteraceae bacterium]
MSIQKWNERYRACKHLSDTPEPLVERFVADLAPGAALDLACGPGRNTLYLAERGWRVTAVDGSPIAIAKLRRHFRIDARVVDLERGEFKIQPDSYDLICDCLYLQRDLFPRMKAGIRAGGMAIVTVLLAGAETPTRVCPGELRGYFEDWKILHYREEAVAELVAVR